MVSMTVELRPRARRVHGDERRAAAVMVDEPIGVERTLPSSELAWPNLPRDKPSSPSGCGAGHARVVNESGESSSGRRHLRAVSRLFRGTEEDRLLGTRGRG